MAIIIVIQSIVSVVDYEAIVAIVCVKSSGYTMTSVAKKKVSAASYTHNQ